MDKQTKSVLIWGGIIVAGYVLLKKPIDSILQSLGLEITPAQQNVNTNLVTKNNNGLDPTFWQQFTNDGNNILDINTATSLANQIYNSHDWLAGGYQFDQVINAFKQLSTKEQVSYMSYIFSQISGGADIITWMGSSSNWTWPFGNRYSAAQIDTVIQYVNNLPNN